MFGINFCYLLGFTIGFCSGIFFHKFRAFRAPVALFVEVSQAKPRFRLPSLLLPTWKVAGMRVKVAFFWGHKGGSSFETSWFGKRSEEKPVACRASLFDPNCQL